MKRKCLAIGISTIAVILLTLTSFTNVVGYQTVQSSNQSVIKERINQRELLFQTIVDIANNKEIQRIILKSQMSRGIFPPSGIPVVTKQQIRQMYFLGLILSKVISKSRIQSMIGMYQLQNPITQEGIRGVIEKDESLRNEITQLQNSECDCENDNAIEWRFPVICILLSPLWIVAAILAIISDYGFYFVETIGYIGMKLNCFWNIVPSNNL
jgi:hypothetical protein